MQFIRFLAVFLLLLYIPLQVQAEENTISSSVDITVSSEAKNLNETLTYILSDKDGREVDRIMIRFGEESKFSITMTEPGTVSYTIRQVPEEGTFLTPDMPADTIRDKVIIYINVMINGANDRRIMMESYLFRNLLIMLEDCFEAPAAEDVEHMFHELSDGYVMPYMVR